ncbi:MAG: type II toxin-antitoxin system RelE/ParE family toxin [Acidobacteriota bacterium]
MTYQLLIRGRAKADVSAAARWYELQRRGLGHEFVAEVDAALNRLAQNPLQYQALYRQARRVIVQRFPYGIFYRIEADKIVVFCVIDLRRNPSTWMKRIPK